MTSLTLLTNREVSQSVVVLSLGFAAMVCWLGGRVSLWYRPERPLVNRVTETRFAELLANSHPHKMARTTYRYLQDKVDGALPILPDDHLMLDLGLSEAEIEASVADLGDRLGLNVTANSRLPVTVADLLTCLEQMPITGDRQKKAA